MVFISLFVMNEVLKQTEKVSGKKFSKRKLLVGNYKPQKVVDNIIGGK